MRKKFTPLSNKNHKIGVWVIFLFISCLAHAQNAKPVSIRKLHPQINLFLHLDKSIYQPQETIWFTGYVLNRDSDLMREQNTLYVVLIDPINKTPILKQRFAIKNGFGKGFLALPDTLAAG